jgi:hypothetical protein
MDHAWAKEKIYRAIPGWPEMSYMSRGHDPKLHEAREGRVMPSQYGQVTPLDTPDGMAHVPSLDIWMHGFIISYSS